jgi:hypothetical protein
MSMVHFRLEIEQSVSFNQEKSSIIDGRVGEIDEVFDLSKRNFQSSMKGKRRMTCRATSASMCNVTSIPTCHAMSATSYVIHVSSATLVQGIDDGRVEKIHEVFCSTKGNH